MTQQKVRPGRRACGGPLLATLAAVMLLGAAPAAAQDTVPPFAELLAWKVALKPELVGVHPRVFVTARELDDLRVRARTTHQLDWRHALSTLAALRQDPPPVPGPQERRSQNNVALAISGVSFAYAIERNPAYLKAAKLWVLTAIEYEPWGYTSSKPNTDLAAGHLLYAIGWAYDLLYQEFTPAERGRIRASLERHAELVYDAFAPKPGRRLNFTQNHDFIPTAGLAVAALALMGESPGAAKWAVLARAHHHRAGQLLSPDGYYYEGIEYWIFSAPWLVHFLDAWEHSTGESLWDRAQFRNWKYYLAHAILPDGQTVFDFGDIWQGPVTRAKQGEDYEREYPTGSLKSNFNVLYRVAARFQDAQAQAVAARYAAFGHTNQEEWWTLLWRDASLAPAPMSALPLTRHFEDCGVVYYRTSWGADATAVALKAGPPEGHRVTTLLAQVPEWRLSSGHAHPDAGSFIIWARGRYLTGDTGYAGQPQARHHNTITVGGQGQGDEGEHDVWRQMDQAALNTVRIASVQVTPTGIRVEADATGAYTASAGLVRFHRTFTVTSADQFSITDTIEARTPKSIEWFLHADMPIAEQAGRYLFGGGPSPLAVTIEGPAGSRIMTEKTILMAPGKPGAITEGPQEQRGYHLVLQSAPLTTLLVRATMTVGGR